MQSFAMSLAIALAMAFAYVPSCEAALQTTPPSVEDSAPNPPKPIPHGVERAPNLPDATPPVAERGPDLLDATPPAAESGPDLPNSVDATTFKIDKLQRTLESLNSKLDSKFKGLETRVRSLESAKARSTAGVATADNSTITIAGKVWCFIAVDDRRFTGSPQTTNQIYEGTANNGIYIENRLRSQCSVDPKTANPENHLGNVQKFSGADFNFSGLRDAIRNQPMDANDVIFVYVACHGYRERNNALGFQMPSGGPGSQERVARASVWNEMKAKGVRQTILISDSCASPAFSSSASVTGAAAANAQEVTGLSWLLLYQTGDVDINGADPTRVNQGNIAGEFGIYSLGPGAEGYFTSSFIDACSSSTPPVSWKKVFDASQALLTRKFPVPLNDGTQITGQTIYLVP